jgi:hypothetical protein
VAIDELNFEIRLLTKQRDDFRDIVHGLPLCSALRPFGGDMFLSFDSSLRLHSSLMSRFPLRMRAVLCYGARNDGRELSPVLFELRF